MSPTFDDLRSRPQPCPTGRHPWVTGARAPLLYCPWCSREPRVPGRWQVLWARLDEGEVDE